MIPNPTRREAPIQDIEHTVTIRKLHCALQSSCLKVAAAEGWPGMSCEHCDVEMSISRDQARADIEGMSRMWAADAW